MLKISRAAVKGSRMNKKDRLSSFAFLAGGSAEDRL
jgi:hypothetical protein